MSQLTCENIHMYCIPIVQYKSYDVCLESIMQLHLIAKLHWNRALLYRFERFIPFVKCFDAFLVSKKLYFLYDQQSIYSNFYNSINRLSSSRSLPLNLNSNLFHFIAFRFINFPKIFQNARLITFQIQTDLTMQSH